MAVRAESGGGPLPQSSTKSSAKKKDSAQLGVLSGNLVDPAWDAQNSADLAAQNAAGDAKVKAADKKSAADAKNAMNVFGTFGNGVIKNTVDHLKQPSQSVGKGPDIVPPGYGQSAPATSNSAMLKAFAQSPQLTAQTTPSAPSSGWGWKPTAIPAAASYKIDLSSLPTLAKTPDLASFMAQAQKSSHLDQVKQPYENVIKQVGSDAAISEAQAQAMYAALQGQLSAGANNIAGGYDATNANDAQTEQALSTQVANTYGAGSSAANAQAQSLGLGSLGGQVADNSLLASQGAVGDLQSGLQASQAQNNGDKAAALAANTDLGAAVGARSAQDVGNMAMAASDAKARVGVAEGQAYNQASQAAASLGGNLWSTALNNNLGAFNAEAGLWGAKTTAGLTAAQQAEAAWAAQQGMSLQGAQLGENQRQYDLGYGLNEQQLLASIMGAKNASNQQAYQDFTKLVGSGQLYNGTQPGSIAAMNQAFQNMIANSQYPMPKFPNSTSLSSTGN